MPSNEALIENLAGAILDGAPIDWASAESSADDTQRPLVDQLRLLASVATLHRRLPLFSPVVPSDRNRGAAYADDHVETPEQWGHLRVLERIGRGAFGEVYRAWDTRLDREVALKLLPASSDSDRRGTSVIEEGRLLARVRHPNVVTIYGAERIEKRIGLWMEFVRGRTLQQTLEQGKKVTTNEVVDIGIELCHAIAAVHGAGLLHRDIKPHNVMLAGDGRIVLMDFGAGHELDDSPSAALAGTPLYLAPELLGGKEPTVRSDTYSLGVLLFYLLTAAYPVRGQNLAELRLAHERRESTDIRTLRPDVAPRLARVVGRAIDPLPERRYQSASDLAGDLMSLRPRPKLVPLAYALAVGAGVVLLVAAGPEIRRWQSGRPGAPIAAAAGTAVNPVERPVIAVLPLKNLSAEPDSDFFADGLTDEIIRNLAVIRGLEVRSQTSSFAFRDKPRNLREVGEQLGANLVVEGSVLRSGNRLRINAQLVQVAGDVPLWAERFDRELKDIFVIQDEISRAVVNKLRLTLGRGQRRYETNPEAYELYLKGRAMLDRRGSGLADSSAKAAELFEQVIAKDPAFAPAYAGLANAHADASLSPYRGAQGEVVSFDHTQGIVRQAAVKALELDPLLAEAHAAMGWLYAREFDWENADRSWRRAIELNATLSHVYVNYSSTTLRPLGKQAEAERLLRAALGHDPLSLDLQRELAMVLIQAGRYQEAVDTFERVREADPDFPTLHYARALTHVGRLPEAISLLGTAPGNTAWLGYAYVRAGRRADAEKLAVVHRGFPFRAAHINAALGDKDQTFEALERMFTSEPQRLAVVLASPEMALLHGDPRLAALRKKLRLP